MERFNPALIATLALGLSAPATASPDTHAAPAHQTTVHAKMPFVKLPRFHWPVPDLLDETDIPGETWARGVPIRLHVVHLRHTQGELLQIYADAFQASGFYIAPDKDQVSGLGITLTALDVKRQISYSAIFEQRPDHTTTVTLGEANLGKAHDPDLDRGEIPLYPGSAHPLRTSSESGSTMTFMAAAKPDEVRAYYRDQLGKVGYVEPDAKHAPGVFVRGKDEVQVAAKQDASENGTSVVITRQALMEGDGATSSPAQIGH